jgi:hypothetical protein
VTFQAFAVSSKVEVPMTASILLDCYCDTCGRQITMDELQSDFHKEHRFSAIELAALQAMRSYLRVCDPSLQKFEFPHS